MVEKEELGQVKIPLTNVVPHQLYVRLVLQHRFSGQNRVRVVGLHDDLVDHVEAAKVVLNIS